MAQQRAAELTEWGKVSLVTGVKGNCEKGRGWEVKGRENSILQLE